MLQSEEHDIHGRCGPGRLKVDVEEITESDCREWKFQKV